MWGKLSVGVILLGATIIVLTEAAHNNSSKLQKHKVPINGKCNLTIGCSGTSECVHGICKNATGHFQSKPNFTTHSKPKNVSTGHPQKIVHDSSKIQKQKVPINGKCNFSTECNGTFTKCEKGICKSTTNHVKPTYNFTIAHQPENVSTIQIAHDSLKLPKPKVPINGKCNFTTECNGTFTKCVHGICKNTKDHFQPSPMSNFTITTTSKPKNVSAAQPPKITHDSSKPQKLKVPINGKCNFTSECNGTFTKCLKGICNCTTGYVQSLSGFTVSCKPKNASTGQPPKFKTVPLLGKCNTTNQCSGRHTECRFGVCKCEYGFLPLTKNNTLCGPARHYFSNVMPTHASTPLLAIGCFVIAKLI